MTREKQPSRGRVAYRVPSAPVDTWARERAEEITQVIRNKKGELELFYEEPLDRDAWLRVMSEFFRYKRLEYMLVGFDLNGSVRRTLLVEGSQTGVSMRIELIVAVALGVVGKGTRSIILAHNHPGSTGALVASQKDYAMKRSLEKALEPITPNTSVKAFVFVRGQSRQY